MSLDVTLYTNIDDKALQALLEQRLKHSAFAEHQDWQRAFPPGPFDEDILSDEGVELKVKSRAMFRLKKEAYIEELAFLNALLAEINMSHQACMLLNGEKIEM